MQDDSATKPEPRALHSWVQRHVAATQSLALPRTSLASPETSARGARGLRIPHACMKHVHQVQAPARFVAHVLSCTVIHLCICLKAAARSQPSVSVLTTVNFGMRKMSAQSEGLS